MPFKQFLIDMVQVLDDAPETVATFAAFGKLGYPHLQLETCCSMPQHAAACSSTAIFFLRTVCACLGIGHLARKGRDTPTPSNSPFQCTSI